MGLAQYISVREVASRMQCSYEAARRLAMRAGAIKIGALVRIREDLLASYLQACPALGKVPASIDDPADPAGTPTSTGTTKTSASKPPTRPKRQRGSGTSSRLIEFERLRKTIAR
jgi:hypothetical protein